MAEEFKPQYSFTDDRLNELKQLFPEAWEDGVFNVDTLRSLIGDHSTDNSVKEHFGLNWVGKQDARKIASKPPTGTLKPAPGEGVNEENTENIFIEGDNLEVLKILRKSYMGKIKMIYIDPPYNTGNDFIYNDSFGDSTEDYLRKSGDKSEEGLLVSNPKTSGRYHANWLTFMYPRIRLAKDTLKEDGVIFISIDDFENSNLIALCDEVFGEENRVEVLKWKRKKQPSFLAKHTAKVMEYVLVYAKNKDLLEKLSIESTSDSTKKVINISNSVSKRVFKVGTRVKLGDSGVIKAGEYSIKTMKVNYLNDVRYVNGKTIDSVEVEARFLNTQENIDSYIDQDLLFITSNYGLRRDVTEEEKSRRKSITDLLTVGWGDNQDSDIELREIFGHTNYFDYTKPTRLIRNLIKSNFTENEIILDFFAGSATTAHATFLQNKEDQGNRKFILVQLPEKIEDNSLAYKDGYKRISDVSKERIRRVINLLDKRLGFSTYYLDSSSISNWKNFESQKDGLLPDLFSKLEAAFRNPLAEGTTPEEFITEVMLQEGFPLTAKQTEVQDGIFKISHDWVPYTLYVSMLQSFKDIDLEALGLSETDHFVCLDMAFENNDALKQTVDNQCKLFTV